MTACGRILACLALAAPVATAAPTPVERALREAIRDRDAVRAREALKGLGDEPGRSAVGTAVAVAIVFPDDETYEAAVAALGRVRGSALGVLDEIVRTEKDHRTHIVALDALARSREEGAAAALIAALHDPNPACLVTALRALGERRDAATIEGRISALEVVEKRRDPLVGLLRESLVASTGQKYILAADWRNWWETVRPRWNPNDLPPPVREGSTTVDKGQTTAPEFFGIPIIARRIVFVIDTSDSMKHTSKVKTEEGGFRQEPMIDLAKRELVRVVRGLPGDARFTILAFSTGVQAMGDALVPATTAAKEKASRFILGLAPKGYTWTEEALQKAFGYGDATAIYLLSDGSPCKGGAFPPTGPILANVRRWNRFRRIPIHALGFPGSNVDFMSALAQQNGGEYRHVRFDAVP
ncbi:MAG: VWA domain-containing protein [Planctomycetes bacterium]|nr:VWA domain-containing protein [Planctomycetota bacterium]